MRLGPEELDDLVGRDASDRITALGAEAIETVKNLIAAHDIDCDFRDGVLYTAHRRRYIEDMRREAEMLRDRYDHPCATHEEEELRTLVGSPAYCFGVSHPTAGHLHPLKYAMGLARAAVAAGVRIHELSEVTAVDGTTVRTANGAVRADHVILACNGYLGALNGDVASRVMPINNFIIATEPLGEERATSLISNGMAVADSKFVVNYFRLSADHRMIFGGRESYGYRFPKDIKSFVRKAMLSIYPQLADARIEYGWGGTLAITMNRMPHFARVAPNVLSCSGYSGQGVGPATLAGKLAAEAIAGQAERFDLLSDIPTPRFPGGVALRWPLLVAAMVWYSMQDRL